MGVGGHKVNTVDLVFIIGLKRTSKTNKLVENHTCKTVHVQCITVPSNCGLRLA